MRKMREFDERDILFFRLCAISLVLWTAVSCVTWFLNDVAFRFVPPPSQVEFENKLELERQKFEREKKAIFEQFERDGLKYKYMEK